MLESDFQTKLIHSVERIGSVVFNSHGHAMQKRGWPDLQIFHTIWTGLLELKVRRNGLSVLQTEMIMLLSRVGSNAFCLRLQDDENTLILEDHRGLILGISDPDVLDWRGNGRRFLLWLKMMSG